jgi:hypothetical protein
VSARLHHHALVAHVVFGTVPVLYLQDGTLFTNANLMETVPSLFMDAFFISAAPFTSRILQRGTLRGCFGRRAQSISTTLHAILDRFSCPLWCPLPYPLPAPFSELLLSEFG